MWKNDFVAAKRILLRNKGFSLINILGLAIGMGACLLMMMYVVNETMYEDFHVRADRIYRIALEWGRKGSRMKFAGNIPALGPALQAGLPEVESYARVLTLGDAELRLEPGAGPVLAQAACYADESFFTMFSYPWLHGDRATALKEPNSAVISSSLAQALFGGADSGGSALGRTVLVGDQSVRIAGIMGDSPPNTHLKPDLVLSFATYEAAEGDQTSVWTQWGAIRTYVLLKQKADIPSLPSRIHAILEKNAPPSVSELMVFHIHPLKRIHWITGFLGDNDPKGSRAYFLFFISAAVLVLAIACFNYVNLTSAQNLERVREIGVRFVLGATRGSIVRQLLRESLVISFAAICIGGIVLESAWRPMMAFIGAPIVLTSGYLSTAAAILGAVFLTAVVAGLFPAWSVSRYKPAEILGKGSNRPRTFLAFRKAFFTVQFVITIALMVASILVFKQLGFVMNSDLGFVKERAYLVPYVHARDLMGQRYDLVRQELERIPAVTAVSSASMAPGVRGMSNMVVFPDKPDLKSGITMEPVSADYGYTEALGLRLASGRWFSREFVSDLQASVLINETAARLLGSENPLGARLKIPRGEELKDVTVIGVLKDFHVRSLHNKINPMMIFLSPGQGTVLVIRARSDDFAPVLDSVRATLGRLLPEARFEIRFLDQEYAKGYASEEKTAQLLGGFAVLAVIISCAGLLGLTSYMIGRRVKEIGIRRVLGASAFRIVSLFSREYILTVLIANLIAWPVSYVVMERWLRNFAYRIPIGVAAFALTATLAFLVVLLTVGILAARAALADPVQSLRDE
jgi:putative ABC transport system permease protein